MNPVEPILPALSADMLRLDQGQLRALIEEISDGAFVLNAEGRFVDASPRAALLMGRTREELLRLRIHDLVAPEELPQISPHLARLLRGEKILGEWRLRQPDGRSLRLELSTRTLAGRLLLCVARDLSSRKVAEENLRATEQRLQRQGTVLMKQARSQAMAGGDLAVALHEITELAAAGMDVARVSVWLFTEDRAKTRCADLFENHKRAHSSGTDLNATDYPNYFKALEENRTVAAADAHTDPRTWEFSTHYLKPLGINSILNAPIRLGGQLAGVLSIEHIGPRRQWMLDEQSFAASMADFAAMALGSAQRVRAAAERLAFERKLQESQKLESLGVLAGGIAHDFNNILTGILGNASLARMVAPPGAEVRNFLEKIETASLRAADLCKEMLAYSGRGQFQMQRLDISSLVEETTHLLQLSISKSTVPRYNLARGLPAIHADATQMRQIVMNLVINASDAIGDRSGIVSIHTGVVRADRDYLATTYLSPDLPEGDYVFIEVSDTGSGMSAETQVRIFDPFFTTKVNGRGLGLAAVLGIVRAHKGALKVHSEVGRGSTFKLLLPCAEGPDEQFAAATAAAAEWRGSGTILVVDDEETVRTVAARMLEAFGFTTMLAAHGRQALDLFQGDPDLYAAVLLDLNMPHMGGVEAFRSLRVIRPKLQVLLMSGFNEEEAVDSFVGQGLAGFIQKPFTPESLREKLQGMLQGSNS